MLCTNVVLYTGLKVFALIGVMSTLITAALLIALRLTDAAVLESAERIILGEENDGA